jgi:hypothetical protein
MDIASEGASSGVERRLTVRAYQHWTGLLGGRPCPSVADCDLLSHAEFAPHAIVLERGGEWVIGFVGARLGASCQARPGQLLAETRSSPLLDHIARTRVQVVERRAPAEMDCGASRTDPPAILYRGILLPFASRQDVIGRIVAVISHQATSAGVRATQRDPPRAIPRREPLFTWADGPLDEGVGLARQGGQILA